MVETRETREQKIMRISALLDNEVKNVTRNISNWHNYLDTASKFYKYGFTDQLLIAAQNPDATICAEYEIWKKPLGRYVTEGSKGIPLLYEENGRKKLRHVFDISATEKTLRAAEINLWNLKPEYENAVIKAMGENYDLSKYNTLEAIIEARTAELFDDDENRYLENVIDNKEDTFLEELDDLNIRAVFADIVRNSTEYIVLSRCGQDVEFDEELFRNVGNFNSNEVITQLGKAVSSISETILREIEKETKAVERQIIKERRKENERHLFTGSNRREVTASNEGHKIGQNQGEFRGNADIGERENSSEIYGGKRSDVYTRSDNISVLSSVGNGRGRGIRDGNVGTEEIGISEEREIGNIRSTADKGTLGTFDGNGQSGRRDVGEADRGNVQVGRSDGGTQNAEYVRMGGQIQQHKEQSKRDSVQRTDLHLSNNDSDKAEDKKSSAFSFARNSNEKSSYIKFTEEQLDIARKTNLVDYLQSRGQQLKRVGREYTMPEHDSMRIRENKFYWNSQDKGGNAIDFCMSYYNMDFQSAVSELLKYNGYNIEIENAISSAVSAQKGEKIQKNDIEEEHKPFPNELENDFPKRVYAYLNQTRGISKETVRAFIDSGKVAQDIKGNAVYKIFDKDGNISGAEISGTTENRFKQTTEKNGNGFSFYQGEDKPTKAVFFESAVDLMSFYDMNKKVGEDFLLVSMAGLKDKVVLKTMEDYGIKSENCYIAADFDEAGKNFANKMQKEYNISPLILFDAEFEWYNAKDYNDLLKAKADNKDIIPQNIVEDIIKMGTLTQNSKFRIEEIYKNISDKKERISAIKKEYGSMGGMYSTNYEAGEINGYEYTAQGIFVKWNTDNGEKGDLISWSNAEKEIGRLIDSGEYISVEEREKYDFEIKNAKTVQKEQDKKFNLISVEMNGFRFYYKDENNRNIEKLLEKFKNSNGKLGAFEKDLTEIQESEFAEFEQKEPPEFTYSAEINVDNNELRIFDGENFKTSKLDESIEKFSPNITVSEDTKEKSDIIKALENGQTIYISDTPVPMVTNANTHYFSNQRLFKDNDGIYKLSGNVVKGSGMPNEFEMPFDTAEKAEAYINSHNLKFYIEKTNSENTLSEKSTETPDNTVKLTVYHGTSADFEKFKPDYRGAIWTTYDFETAKRFAPNIPNGKVITAEVKFKNPQKISYPCDENWDIDETVRNAKRQDYDGIIIDFKFDKGENPFYKFNLEKYPDNYAKDVLSSIGIGHISKENETISEFDSRMKASGYVVNSYVAAFDSEQIKILNKTNIYEKEAEEEQQKETAAEEQQKEAVFEKVGTFYEIYGADAVDIADMFDFRVSRKNGDYVLGIPDHKFEELKEKLAEQGYHAFVNEEKMLAKELKIGDVIKLPSAVFALNDGTKQEFPNEYGVIKGIEDDLITLDVYAEKELKNLVSESEYHIAELDKGGFEYIRKETEYNIKITAEELKIGDVVKLPPVVMVDTKGKEKIFPSEYGVIENIEGNMISFQTYSDKNLQNTVSKTGFSVDSLNRQGFEYIGSEEEIKNKLDDRHYADKETENNSDKDNFSEKDNAENLKVGDVIKFPVIEYEQPLLDGVGTVDMEFNTIFGVVENIENEEITFQTYFDNLERPTAYKTKETISSLNESGYEYIGTETEIKKVSQDIIKNADLVNKKSQNFHITDDNLGIGTQSEKYNNNINAIKTLLLIEKENRQATHEEQEILSRYIGWGGLQEVFAENKPNWEEKYGELKNLLSEEEYNLARSTTLNAHYTSPIVIKAIHKGLENLGFKGGKMLEPSMGVGNFFGCMPESLSDKTRLYGVEIDDITGRIAKQLYPDANIQIKGFEKTNFKDDFFDVAVGNVPFGEYQVTDKNFKSNALIHDYFFQKSINKVRSGGVVAYITSKGTLDKKDNSVRKYLAERADLLGAVRLPNETFKANAGTEATFYDIIFLQKKESISDFTKEPMPDWVDVGTNKDGYEINNYFIENPDMICGELTTVSSQYGPKTACKGFENRDFEEVLNNAINNIKGEIPEKEITSLIDYIEEEQNEEILNVNPEDYKNFCYCLIDEKIYFRENDVMKKASFDKTKESRVKGMIGISEALRDLIAYQKEHSTDEGLAEKQKILNEKYENFTEKYGLLSDSKNKGIFKEDDTSALLLSLENVNDKGELTSKAEIFTKRTIVPYIPVEHVDTASEALVVSISEKAKVDLDFMSKLCSKPKEEIVKDLEGVIFENPETKQYENADEYLSGNVRRKLEIAKECAKNDSKYEVNVKSLTEVQPKDLKPSEIAVQLGSSWVPAKYYQQFMYELFDTPYAARQERNYYGSNPYESGSGGNSRTIMLAYDPNTATFGISNKSADKGNLNVVRTYGTDRMNAYKILEETLNMKPIKVMDYYEDAEGKKRSVLNEKETLLAQEKQNIIKNKFNEWIFNDLERTEDLCRIYNDRFNSVRPREYDGSHITFGGINSEIHLRQHQVNAIAHTLYGGNTLLAHAVGSGKSATRS